MSTEEDKIRENERRRCAWRIRRTFAEAGPYAILLGRPLGEAELCLALQALGFLLSEVDDDLETFLARKL